MPKFSEHMDLQKHTINLYRGDFDLLKEIYPDLGGAIIIRKLVRNLIIAIKQKQDEENPIPKDILHIDFEE